MPPPLIMRPISDHITVEEEDLSESDSFLQRNPLLRKNGRGKSMSDIIEESNPFATVTSTSLVRTNTLESGHPSEGNSDIRFQSLCIIPFFEISRIIRSNKLEALYKNFHETAPDFYLWKDMEAVVGDDFLADIDLHWVDEFETQTQFIYQFLNCFAEVCQDLSGLDVIACPFWEGIPGYFVYLQLFLSAFQSYIVRKSSQFIVLHNGEDDRMVNSKAVESM